MGNSNLRSIEVNEEDKVETFMNHTTMNGGNIKIQMKFVGIGELNLTGQAEVDQGMNKITEEEVLEAILGHIRILEDRIAEENTEVIVGVIVIVEIEVGVNLEKGHFQETIPYKYKE